MRPLAFSLHYFVAGSAITYIARVTLGNAGYYCSMLMSHYMFEFRVDTILSGLARKQGPKTFLQELGSLCAH